MPFLHGTDVVLAADCVPFAYAGFHRDFVRGRALLVACPKLDDFQAHQRKLTDILRQTPVKSLTVVHVEVPYCSGLAHMAKQAIRLSGGDIPFREVIIGIGDVDAKTLSMVEQGLMEEGVSQEELRGLCDMHLKVLRQGEAETSTCRETKVAYSNNNNAYHYD